MCDRDCFNCPYEDCVNEELTQEERNEITRRSCDLYVHSPGYENRRKYEKTAKGKERKKRYENSPRGKERIKKYAQTEEAKELNRQRCRRYYYRKKGVAI